MIIVQSVVELKREIARLHTGGRRIAFESRHCWTSAADCFAWQLTQSELSLADVAAPFDVRVTKRLQPYNVDKVSRTMIRTRRASRV